MLILIIVGFSAGVITSLSPCVLPVLPVVLAASASPVDGVSPAVGSRSKWRPFGVVAGLVISFSASTLFGSWLLSALHLPQDLLRDAGIAVLVLVGLGLIVPTVGELLERPFARMPRRALNPDSNGIILGFGLGLVFVPCAGPVLATIAVVGATHHFGLDAIVLTVSFGLGVGVPLLALALAGDSIARRTGILRRHARGFRLSTGVIMILLATLIGLNLTDGLQRHVPGYTTALQNSLEQNKAAAGQLRRLTTTSTTGPGAAADNGGACTEGGQKLENCGQAPPITGITGWLNTPGDQPLSLASLRGKVVLIDFWTYSCINCQRTLPHVEAWYNSYAKDGFVVIGVHTPEFAFEHVASNVRAQASALGVKYPVAIDNNYATWNAYSNQYWPAEYLIDPSGVIRHVTFGEGDYGATETLIRQLLSSTDLRAGLPAATDVPNTTPTESQTPETYLGYNYKLDVTGDPPVHDHPETYSLPPELDPDTFALAGTWSSGAEALTAGAKAELALNFQAHDVYLVLGGSGMVTVEVNGTTTSVVYVSGVPKLYTLYHETGDTRAELKLIVSPGIQAYDFTFG